jgi:hypothetical protein
MASPLVAHACEFRHIQLKLANLGPDGSSLRACGDILLSPARAWQMRCATAENEATYDFRFGSQDVGGFARSCPDPSRALPEVTRAAPNHGQCPCNVQFVRSGALSYLVDIIVILEFRQP